MMNSSTQFPSVVMIIRHGEKPGTAGSDKDGGPHLSVLGSARAAALPSLFTPDPNAKLASGLQQLCCHIKTGAASQFAGAYSSSGIAAGQARFPTPDFLFATKKSADSDRPVETIRPLAQALNLQINDSFTNTQGHKGIKGLKSEIRKDPDTYGGKVILICWHHSTAPKLAEDLGVPSDQLKGWDPWDPAVFDLVFYITWDKGQANLVVNHQQLLYGDSTALTPLTAPGTNKQGS